jgi:hypothetical protein
MEPELNTMVPSPGIPLIKEGEELSYLTEPSINQSPTENEVVDTLLQPHASEEEISENWMQTAENVDKSIDTASTNLDAIGCNWMLWLRNSLSIRICGRLMVRLLKRSRNEE